MVVAKPGFKMFFKRDDTYYYLVNSKTTNLIHIRRMDDSRMDFICGIDGDLLGPIFDKFVTCHNCAKIYLALEKV